MNIHERTDLTNKAELARMVARAVAGGHLHRLYWFVQIKIPGARTRSGRAEIVAASHDRNRRIRRPLTITLIEDYRYQKRCAILCIAIVLAVGGRCDEPRETRRRPERVYDHSSPGLAPDRPLHRKALQPHR